MGVQQHIITALEFDQTKDRLLRHCMGPLGKAHVLHLEPATDINRIQRQLDLVAEYRKSIDEQEALPVRGYESIKEELDQIKVTGYVLPVESFQKLRPLFHNVAEITSFFSKPRHGKYPLLYTLCHDIFDPTSWILAIDRVFDEEGNVKPDASTELKRLSNAINGKNGEVDKTFRRTLNRFKDKGMLSDTAESIRNGRRVLSVNAEHKRQIEGIIHDESATGKTSFIEPSELVILNNEIVELELARRKEIYKLMKVLSDMIHPYAEEIRAMYHLVGHLDFIRAKTRLGLSYDGEVPELVDRSTIKITQGRHPILFLKNKKEGKETIAFDLVLHGQNRLLLLSGPNAGGKSILMKAVGLMQLMVQSGMMVPVDKQSTFGIFDQFFVDIGDQQSIENELSTYSSHLANMRDIFEHAGPRSLVLIDEFGSGTDPKLGAAIAESMLAELNHKKVAGVITTHYANLKVYAFKHRGIVNGAMVFDKDQMVPTYRLQIGRPGSSFTFEIAERSGLPKQIIRKARRRSGKALQAMEDLIADMEQKQAKLERKLEKAVEKEKRLDQLVKNYERMSHDLDVKKKKFKLAKKETDYQQVAELNKEVEKVVRELKEQESLEIAKKKLADIKQKKDTLRTEVVALNEHIGEAIRKDVDLDSIVAGSYVTLHDGTARGEVQSIDKKHAFVAFGGMTMRVKLNDLVPVHAPVETNGSKSILTQVESTGKFDHKLDIRGMRPEEALKTVEQFMDEALLANALNLQIIHGKGSGALRNIVKGKLKEYPVSRHYHPEREQGGDGVTFIEM